MEKEEKELQTDKELSLQAMAKVNLILDVTGKRPDGYHEVRMIMQTVNLYDELTFSIAEDEEIHITCDKQGVPCDERNLIYKAARLLLQETGCHSGIYIDLKKRIPIAAGMAGGSADAAITLIGLNQLFSFGFSTDQLKEFGVRLGADVPYCIEGGTVLSEGIGEILTKLPDMPRCYLVIAKPEISVSTRYVYEHLDLSALKKHPDVDGMITAIQEQSLQGVANRMENVLESVTEKKYPVIGKIKEILTEHGAVRAMMSGSGPTVFALFEEEFKAKYALKELMRTGMVQQGYTTTFVQTTGQQVSR